MVRIKIKLEKMFKVVTELFSKILKEKGTFSKTRIPGHPIQRKPRKTKRGEGKGREREGKKEF